MFREAQAKELSLDGPTGRLLRSITKNWLIGIRETNPAILGMFRDRELYPYRRLLPWSGEFAGKYITGCAAVYRATLDADLRDYAENFIGEMLTLQQENGYFGVFDAVHRLAGTRPDYRDYDHMMSPSSTEPEGGNAMPLWDSWAHYHMMIGLYSWYRINKCERYLAAIEQIADLFIRRFYGDNPTLLSTGSDEMNLSVYHMFAVLYGHTKKAKYLEFAHRIEEDIANAGNYLNFAREKRPFYLCPRPRWESLHIIIGIAAMFRATGEKEYLDMARQIFFSILETDVHNTGGFSTREQAVGHPFSNEPVETCCVVAYNALACELYELTGDPAIADFLEWSHYNAVMGSHSKSGRWSTYNTPMEGYRKANYHDIVFQSRAGSPDLNCCSVNAARGPGLVSQWYCAETEDCIHLNFYEEFQLRTDTYSIGVRGAYPYRNRALIDLQNGSGKALALRIPAWSKKTTVTAGDVEYRPAPGGYFELPPETKGTVTVDFDFTPRLFAGEREYEGKASILCGPLLLGLDHSDNPGIDFNRPPVLPYRELTAAEPEILPGDKLSLCVPTDAGKVRLCDFYSLGQSGCAYKTWLSVSEF